MGAINEKVMAAVKKVGEAGGYVYVVDLNTGAIPYVNSQFSTDISDQESIYHNGDRIYNLHVTGSSK